MSKSSALPIITICVLFTIVSLVIIARGSFAAKDKFSIPTIQNYNNIAYDHEINETEGTVTNLFIILAIIMTLISFGVIIARRNQLFIKEVGCNECNEEGA